MFELCTNQTLRYLLCRGDSGGWVLYFCDSSRSLRLQLGGDRKNCYVVFSISFFFFFLSTRNHSLCTVIIETPSVPSCASNNPSKPDKRGKRLANIHDRPWLTVDKQPSNHVVINSRCRNSVWTAFINRFDVPVFIDLSVTLAQAKKKETAPPWRRSWSEPLGQKGRRSSFLRNEIVSPRDRSHAIYALLYLLRSLSRRDV